MNILDDLDVSIFADGGSLDTIIEYAANPLIGGFTTNPTLMRAAGVQDYESFAKKAVAKSAGKPISFEVFADDYRGMVRQALLIKSWGDNVYVKIPAMYTTGASTADVIAQLASEGVKVNVTGVFTLDQVNMALSALHKAPSIISVFAGRIADSGHNPLEYMKQIVRRIGDDIYRPQLLWASPRQVYDVVQANEAGCDIITMTAPLLSKLSGFGKDLTEYSRETICMFYDDAAASGYRI